MRKLDKFEVAKIRKKGEFTVPKDIRERVGWDEGDHVKICIDGNKVTLEKIQG